MTLRKGADSWPRFIEITERRNLFVHTDAVVSSQYLAVCRRHNAPIDKGCTVGQELEVSAEYYQEAVECFFEIGVKLSQVIWRKLLPKQLMQAEKNLQGITFVLLTQEKYSLAKKLLQFATASLKSHGSEEYRLMHIVNLAIAYKNTGEQQAVRELLKGVDWSATANRFKLAVAVLTDDKEKALGLIRRIGSSDEVGQMAYMSWPVFRELRNDRDFLALYEEIFDAPYQVLERHKFFRRIRTEEPSEED